MRLPLTGPPLGLPYTLNYRSPQARGLVGWYPTVGQERSGGIPGMAIAAGVGTFKNGAYLAAADTTGQAISMDGSDDYLLISQHPALDFTDSYTISMWVYLRQLRLYEMFFCRGDGTTDDIEYYIGAADGRVTIVHNRGNGGTFTYLQLANIGLAAGVWQFLTATYDAADSAFWRLYRNGVQRASGVTVGGGVAALDTNRNWRIGATVNTGTFGTTNEVDGLVADVRMYNRALSAGEVWAMYAPQTRWELYDVRVGAAKAPGTAASGVFLGGVFNSGVFGRVAA